ncbi:hypothetical protein F4775DRAFT_595153 [Biscogniauxia sp. FL1348]|nr:hypothetical protein F4775DRAFT_595153 [Biscogniauxia sp. FL1348]
MSGVKNLRAMFEQRGENNPPDRGRSPGPGMPIGSPTTESPRPLSKVRTSFVAIVEKDGRVGLRRENSGDSTSASSQKLGNDNETTTPQSIAERSDASGDSMAQPPSFKRNLTYEPIFESPKQDASPYKGSPKKGPSTPEVAPNANPDKITDEEEPKTKMLPGNPTEASAVRMSGKTTNGSIGDVLNGISSAPKPKTTKTPPKAVAPISTSVKTAAKALKSPLPLRERPKASSSTPEKKTPSTSTTPAKDAQKKKVATKPSTTVRKPATAESSAAASKAKPRSPTRPIKLPPSLTTHTASSASKAGGSSPPSGRTLSRASGGSQHLNAPTSSHRPPSRTSLGTSGTRPPKRQSSSVPRLRPSVGPPPKQTARDHPIVKKEPQVDESFLARMMRPTQSSSSKASEKAPVTPPRRPNSTTVKRTVPKEVEAKAKKASAKVHAATSKPKEAKEAVKTVAKETPTTRATRPAAKPSTKAPTASVEKKVVKAASTAKGVAPAAAQTTTSEDAAAATSLAEKETEAIVEPSTPKEVGKTVANTEQTAEPTTVVTSAPEKVEDIEEVVQETVGEPTTPKEETVAVESSQPAPVESDPAVAVEESKAEEPVSVAEEPKTDAAAEEAKVEGEQAQANADPMLETY